MRGLMLFVAGRVGLAVQTTMAQNDSCRRLLNHVGIARAEHP